MNLLKKLNSTHQENNFSHFGLLILRLGLGILMMRHGFAKMENFSEYSSQFYDFLGLGPKFSLILTVFSEFFCSILLILGLLTRIASIPLIITMMVIVFMVHGEDPLSEKELPVIYLIGYIVILLKGGGKYSVDARIL